jgi:hypothetical protein
MSISYNWLITDLKRQIDDGFVFAVRWSLDAFDDSFSSGTYGSIALERPDDLIPFEDLTPDIVVQWVKDYYGPEMIASFEEALAVKISNQKNPTDVASGFPSLWGLDVAEPVDAAQQPGV